MKCDRARPWVEALADGEVRGLRRIALGRHLARCPGCSARLDEALGLQRRIRGEAPRFRAPASLRASLEQLREKRAGPPATASPLPWRWAIGGALGGAAATMVLMLAFGALVGPRAAADASLAMVSEHARATLEQRAVVVASSDRHTVRPWLSSHLDYSPPVHDFGDEGFALQGARISTLHGLPVAVLAYGYRLHSIDVYVQPSSRTSIAAPATIRGFNLMPFRAHGMDWTIVSDASPETLRSLAQAIREAGP